MSKKITINCHGPIAVSHKYEVYWEDVYLSWTGKPGRTTYRIAPILISKTDAENEYGLVKELQEESPEYVWSDEIEELETALTNIKNKQIYIRNPKDPLCAIYTPKESIDRTEAERMIRELMVKYYGFNDIRCKWKRPKLVVIPTSIPHKKNE